MDIRDTDKTFANHTVEVPLFPEYIIPNGGLSTHRESHGLFYYYLLAMQAMDTELNGIVYEGDKDPLQNYRQLFQSVARLYNVDPDAMNRAWPDVDKTCVMHNMPILPVAGGRRLETAIVIHTNH